jgi:hypothetical protein
VAAEQTVNAGQKDRQLERLGQLDVRTGTETTTDTLRSDARREHERRNESTVPSFRDDTEPVDAGGITSDDEIEAVWFGATRRSAASPLSTRASSYCSASRL